MLVNSRNMVIPVAVCLGLMLAGCGNSGTPETGQAKPGSTPAAAGATQATAKNAESKHPEWIAPSRNWPDTMRWAFDSAGEHVQDGLFMRLRPEVAQNFIPGLFKDAQPLQCQLFMTLRPIPEWPLARGLVIDSVVFHDPIRRKTLPGLPMMPTERASESQTVRTSFATVMKKPYTPTVTEGQLLEPTVYMHWDKRQIVATLPPVPVRFVRSENQ